MKCALLLMTMIPLAGQPLRVYSEFARIDALGEVAAPAQPREILSPAIARNAFTSFQIVVQVIAGAHYWLYVGQNPEDAVRVTLYRETDGRLDPVELPYAGDGTQIFWMDVWADSTAPSRRVKVEPQLNVGSDWVVYPMEVRVMDATVPDGRWPEGSATPVAVMRSFVCGTKIETVPAAPQTVSRFQFRNAQQDVALAARAPKDELRKLLGGCEAAPPDEPEWHLRVRDYLFRMR